MHAQNGIMSAKADYKQRNYFFRNPIGTAAFVSGKVAIIFLGLLGALNATHLCASR